MKSIDRLSDSQVLALAHFIAGCVQRGSRHWRTQFCECARRNSFGPYAKTENQEHLRSILHKHDRVFVCGLVTAQVLEAANQVAAAWGEPPVTLDVAQPASTEASG
jgi:hypothetical protein